MHTSSRIPATHPVRAAHRTATLLVPLGVLGVLGAAGALATWRGTPPAVVIPTAAVVAVIVVFVAARRALRRAAARIETILREEVGRPEV